VLVSRTGPLMLKKTNRSLPGVGWTILLDIVFFKISDN
jgi:hypothetical protein